MLTANAALTAPAETVTWPGGTRFKLLLVRATSVPPAGATAMRVTVQLAIVPPMRLLGLHTREATPGCDP